MKRLALAVALISSALLSGCIVVPSHRYHHGDRGGYERGYDRGYDRGHDDRGYGPGRR